MSISFFLYLERGKKFTRTFRSAHFRFPLNFIVCVSISFPCSNIDSHIRQAETEYQLEREETNLLNLQDEKRTLLLRFGGSIHQWGRNGVGGGGGGSSNNLASSLFRSVSPRFVFLAIWPNRLLPCKK